MDIAPTNPLAPIADAFLRELPSHKLRLWRFALRLTRHMQDAEDLLQRTYLRALEKRHQWQPATSLIAWLLSIMHSVWVSELRSAQRRRMGSLQGEEDFDDMPDTAAAGDPEFSLLCQQIVKAVNALPEVQRTVMLAVAVEGLSYQEAAEVLDIPIGTVMSRLSRARQVIGQRFLQSVHSSSSTSSASTILKAQP